MSNLCVLVDAESGPAGHTPSILPRFHVRTDLVQEALALGSLWDLGLF